MRRDKQEALILRLEGYSYSEIKQKLGVPKATLSDWFSNLIISKEARNRILKRTREKSIKGLIKKNKLQTHAARQRAAEYRKHARKQIRSLSKKDLLILGAALYWAEGYKKPIIKNGQERTYHKIGFTNTDPEMVKLFMSFLKNALKIPEEKIKANVHIFKHINEREALEYWQGVTKLPSNNFQKFYYGVSKSSQGKRPYNRLPYGTIQLTVGSTQKFHTIMGWIEGIIKNI